MIGLPGEHQFWMKASFIEIIERSLTAPQCPALYSHMTTPLCILFTPPPHEQLQAPILTVLLSVDPFLSVNSNLDAGNGKQSQMGCLSQECLMLTCRQEAPITW